MSILKSKVMKKLIPVLIVAAFMIVANSAYAQPRRNVLDGAYVQENNPQRRVKEWPYLREADSFGRSVFGKKLIFVKK